MKAKYLLLFFLAVKFFLDFLSAHRDLNFLILNALCVVSLFFVIERVKKLSGFEIFFGGGYFIVVVFAFVKSGDYIMFLKFLSPVLIYLNVKTLLGLLNWSEFSWVCRKCFQFFVVLFSANYIISLIFYDPLGREFYGFEHANLMGSYVLLSVGFVCPLVIFKGEERIRYWVVIMAYLSTSTGAFISSLLLLIPQQRFSFLKVLLLLLYSLAFIFIAYFLTKFVFYDFHVKVFGTFRLILDGGFNDLMRFSGLLLPMSELGEEYQSSLVWRLYAYFIFWGYFLSMDAFNVLTGLGFQGHLGVWGGVAPHNDFLLCLIDFGVVAFFLSCVSFSKIICWSFKNKGVQMVGVILGLRLFLENNIYSYYILSGLVVSGLFLYFFTKRFECV